MKQNRLEDRITETYRPDRIYTPAFKAAALGFIPAIANGMTSLYNGVLHTYNDLMAAAGLDQMVRAYATHSFSRPVVTATVVAAIAAAAVGTAAMIYEDSHEDDRRPGE